MSSIDVTSIVNNLMQFESVGRDRLSSQKTKFMSQLTALESVRNRVTGVQTAAGKLNAMSEMALLKATPSDETAFTATASTSAQASSLTFTIDTLAAAEGRVSASSVAATTSIVATGSFSINGVSIGAGDGTLSDVVKNINASTAGVNAAAVKVGPNAYRLQLTSKTTGAASAVNVVDGGNLAALGAFNISQAGSDAQITIGSGVGAYQVTSTTNVLADVLPGVSLTLKKQSASPVTVDVARDNNGIADLVQGLVDAANGALNEIKTQSGVTIKDAAVTTKGPLAGSYAMRQLTAAITDAVIGAVPGSTYVSPGLVGVGVDSKGSITLDRGKLLAELEKDPDAVARMFAAQGTASDSRVSFATAGNRTPSGSYAINVTQAAAAPIATGFVGVDVQPFAQEITVRVGSTDAIYWTTAGQSLAQVRDGLNAAINAAGLQPIFAELTTVGPDNALRLTSTSYGSNVSFEARFSAMTSFSSYAGQDVAGTIGGVAATGIGQRLQVSNITSNLNGLGVDVRATTAEVVGPTALGTLDFAPGLAQRLLTVAADALDATSGSLQSGADTVNTTIKDLDAAIAAYDYRLEGRRASLTRQYSQLNATLAKMNAQASSISGLLGNASSILPGIA